MLLFLTELKTLHIQHDIMRLMYIDDYDDEAKC